MTLRVLIAEDSEIFAQLLSELLASEPDLELLAVVSDGEAAVRACRELSPDLILMDIQMPLLDGLQATELIMASTPTPILVVTSDPFRGGVDMTFKALRAGALDLVDNQDALDHLDAALEREKVTVVRSALERATLQVR